jgi:phospholipid/cholesterol/gamma-HCH transport system substrate-binding protein
VRSVSVAGRAAAIIAVALAIVIVGFVLFRTAGDGYTAKARFINAGQLVKGNPVQTGGVAVGSVKDIKITDDGQAEITFSVEEDSAPLRKGTKATIRQFSQSGIANRYIDLEMPPNNSEGELEEGSLIGTDDTTTQVDLDELFNTLDPETRKGLQGFFRGQARQFCKPDPNGGECEGFGERANAGFEYLNPALATSSRLFNELTRDTPVLERFLVDSSRLVGTLAERRDDLAALIGNLNETTRALGNQKAALAESIEQLPPFMRRANTTFVNLRAALDDVDPLVDASKPVARELGPFLRQARAFAADAEPTIRDLRLVIRKPGRDNDSIELVNSVPPLEEIALVSKERSVAPGGRRESVGQTRGAFPESIEAFRGSTPIFAQGRPYTTDLMGWFDDFSTTGPGFDALGLNARAQIGMFENFGVQDGRPVLNGGPLRAFQYKRCPGGSEEPAPDGSNAFSAEEQAQLRCEESARAVGDVR